MVGTTPYFHYNNYAVHVNITGDKQCVHVAAYTSVNVHVYTHTILVVFERLTEKHLPELYNLLKHKLQILAMISLSWFLTVFLTVMDSDVAVNIMDCFFIDGAKVHKH